MINVTKTTLPSLKTYNKYLRDIWKTHWLTNNGKYVQQLEKELTNVLKVQYLVAVSNGTLALQLIIKALKLKGEVITTPFTFAATTNVLIWEGLTPVFVDIDPYTFNISPVEVEKKITRKTSAILAVHVYGNPCDVESLEKIAKKYNIKLIYDAAHAFGVKYKNRSILTYGNASTLSFHATKTFHTIEGGAIVTTNKTLFDILKLYENFGIKSEEEVLLPGINAKMNEFQAAMGLANVAAISRNTKKRQHIYSEYVHKLQKASNIRFQTLTASEYNYSYMPIVVKDQITRDLLYRKLIEKGYKSRKYFYPLTSDFPFINNKISNNLDNSKTISNSILCLPIYHDIKISDVYNIIEIIKKYIE